MTEIIAGRFEQQGDAEAAVERLLRRGFRRDRISLFFVNPPGQHAQFPVGGDRNVSPGARGAGTAAAAGAALGGAVGLAAGLAASSALGPVAPVTGATAGAYLGALGGALTGLHDRPSAEETPAGGAVRAGGVMVAACVPTADKKADAARVLRACGAVEIESARGTWRNGSWADFDPVAPPEPLEAPVRKPGARRPAKLRA